MVVTYSMPRYKLAGFFACSDKRCKSSVQAQHSESQSVETERFQITIWKHSLLGANKQAMYFFFLTDMCNIYKNILKYKIKSMRDFEAMFIIDLDKLGF